MTTSATTTQEARAWDLYFACHKPNVMTALSPFLTKDVAGIVADYVVGNENPFGLQEWQEHFFVDVNSDQPKLKPSFYNWWFGPDSIDSTKQCCETHLPPVLQCKTLPISRLRKLVSMPRKGFKTHYLVKKDQVTININDLSSPAWLVLRKDVLQEIARILINKLLLKT